jgi:orotate phosphoribosyltransferase
MTQENIISIFKETGALLDGHFELTSGLHSPQYFQCAKVLQYPRHAEFLCRMIAENFAGTNISVVLAPAIGGIVVAQEVGRLIASTRESLRTMFAERKEGAMWLRRGFELGPADRVLVCEDVVTTGGSVAEVIDIVRKSGAALEGVACIVDRSGGKVKFNVPPGKQFAALHMEAATFHPAECPLCRDGIPIDKPGSRGNA